MVARIAETTIIFKNMQILALIRTLSISPIKKKTRVKPYEYMVGDQVVLETPILRKLLTPCTGPYSVKNVYRNGIIRIQKDRRESYQKEGISVESLHSIQSPIKYDLRGDIQ
jgi:hypothetical protein